MKKGSIIIVVPISIFLIVFIYNVFTVPIVSASEGCCGKCTGSSYCRACKNCKYCAHCNSGGSCGVCSAGSRNSTYSNPSKIDDNPSLPLKTFIPYAAFVKTKTLNVRSRPGLEFLVVAVLSYNDKVSVVDEIASGWVKIHFTDADGIIRLGYVFKEYLKH